MSEYVEQLFKEAEGVCILDGMIPVAIAKYIACTAYAMGRMERQELQEIPQPKRTMSGNFMK